MGNAAGCGEQRQGLQAATARLLRRVKRRCLWALNSPPPAGSMHGLLTVQAVHRRAVVRREAPGQEICKAHLKREDLGVQGVRGVLGAVSVHSDSVKPILSCARAAISLVVR